MQEKIKAYRIELEICVVVPDDGLCGMTAEQWAQQIANQYLEMSRNYKSIGAYDGNILCIEDIEGNLE